MDVLVLFSSLNKIGLLAFLLTLGFLIYEIVLLKKAGKPPEKPAIPQFKEGLALSPVIVSQSGQKKTRPILGRNMIIVICLSVMVMIFGSISLIGIVNLATPKKTELRAKTISPTTPMAYATVTATIFPTEIPTILPSLTQTPTIIESPTSSPSPSPILTEVISPTPSDIRQLPVTGKINNLLIIFAVSSIVVFFSFIL